MNKNFPKVIRDRLTIIKKYCKDRVVLDIGSVEDPELIRESYPWWLHKQIKSVASEIVGVDIYQKGVEKLREKGYNIIVGDAVAIDLGRKFDVIVAGEFIEHISNHGLFLDNMRKHLKDDGILILTTPNLFALRYQLRNLITGKVMPEKEHVCWFEYFTLKELCERHGFILRESFYYFDAVTPWYKYYPVRAITLFRKNYAPRLLFILEKK